MESGQKEEEKQQSIERCTLVKQVLCNLAGGAAMSRSIAPRSSENQILSLDASIGKIKNIFMIPGFEMKGNMKKSSVTWRVVVFCAPLNETALHFSTGLFAKRKQRKKKRRPQYN